jgi:hypothetical protein
MLDVHAPHEATHTWKDFFIHIATICVGLLIAIGLEQTVEAIHRHQERAELRASLDAESRQILRDTENVEDGTTADIAWFKQAEQQLSDAVVNHRAAGEFPQRPHTHPWDVPDNPVYTAAKSSGRLALLDQDEVVAYGELDSLINREGMAYTEMTVARDRTATALRELGFGKPVNVTFASDSSPDDLRRVAETFADHQTAVTSFRLWSRQARGAVTAILSGQRDLHAIERAERQFDKLP